MDTSQQQNSIQVDPTEFVNLVVGAALGNGLPAGQPINFSARRSKPTIVIACAPKSGSTFLSNVVSRTTKLPYFRLSSAYSTNEHDLYLPALYIMNNGGCVSQLHMKGTFHNAALLKVFGIKPVILVRNIEDTIVSLADDLRTKERQIDFGSGASGFSFLWQDPAIASLNDSSLIDCLIDLALPWYVNFYVSWYRLCARHDVDAIWVTYEEMMRDKRKTVSDILEFTGFGKDIHIDAAILDERYTKFNKGQTGRGSMILSEDQKARIKRLFSYYPDVDFSKYGLENNKAPMKMVAEKAPIGVVAETEKTLSSDDLVDIGEEHHKAGRLQEAESFYRKALEIDPGHPGALFFLASIAYEDGRLQFSKQLIDKLLRDESNDAEAWHLLGMAVLKEGNYSLAVEHFKQAIAIQPAYAQAHYSLGAAFSRLGDVDAALEGFRRALALNPAFAEACCSIGNIFRAQSKFEEALSSYRQAINVKSDFELAYENIGGILLSQGESNEAIAIYRKAVAEVPNSALLHANLGAAYLSINQHDDAAASFERALALDPSYVLAQGNLGVIYLQQNKISKAIAAFQRVLEINPEDSLSLFNLGKALHKAGKSMDAIECFNKAIALNPDFIEAQSYLLMLVSYLPEYSREKIYADHAAFGEHFEAPLRKKWPVYFASNPQKRLRVGFVSGDLHSHPVGYFLEGVLRELHKLDEFDIVVYSTNATEDLVTDRLRAAANVWLPVFALSDDAFERRIQDDNIDILVDLSGHTGYNRLMVFAHKPAPIQVSWLGYWETTGLRAIDYILCDRYSVHGDEEKFYTERPWYLPNTRLCFTQPTEKISVATLPALSTGHVTFGCFNSLTKMTNRAVAVWSRILKRAPNARLLLKSHALADSTVRENVMARFAAEGIAADRLLLEQGSPRHEYLAAYNRVDIALDPFPFPGATTSVEGIWMGVPMITMRGNRIVSRQGESILQNLGLQDWIAAGEDEYVELAVRHSEDLSSLAKLRGDLRERLVSSPLCNAKLFAKNLEGAFKQMWDKFCES